MAVVGNVVTVLVLVAGLVSGGLAVAAWWNRHQPGIYWFAVYLGLLSLWSFAGFWSFVAESQHVTRSLGLLANGVSLSVSLSWFLFIVTYLHPRERLSRWIGGAVVFGLGGLYCVLYLTTRQTHILANEIHVEQWHSYAVLAVESTTVGTLSLIFALSLFFIGLGLVIQAFMRGRLKPVQAAIILCATFVPFLGSLLLGSLLVPIGVPFIQQASALSVVLYAATFSRYDLFTFSPATEQIGVERAFDDLGAGILVTEDQGQIIRTNNPCCEILDYERDSLLGQDIADMLSVYNLTLSALPSMCELDNSWYQVSSSPVRSANGETIGHAVLFTDVTDQRLREQRLDVLNRVLRHNLRNDLQVLTATAQMLTKSLEGEDEELAQQVLDITGRLESTSTKARTIEQFVEQTQSKAQRNLSASLDTIVHSHRTQFPDVSFSLDCPDECVIEVSSAIELAFENIIENAAEHNDADEPSVGITVTDSEDAVMVSVSDNGPGIGTHELAAIEDGEETGLKHGSGLGLWAIQWAIDNTDAELSYDTGGDGTDATIHIPR
jgi:signal transduction histidine kinase